VSSRVSVLRSGRRYARASTLRRLFRSGRFEPSLGTILIARVAQLALVFVGVTLLVLAPSVVAQAMR
jgi:hypothetical protein